MAQQPQLRTFHEQPITRTWLAQNLESSDLRVLDARLLEDYAEAHIPRAVHVDLRRLRHFEDGVEGMLVEAEDFAKHAGQLGIGRNTLVVIYDDFYGQLAARVGWSLLYYGHSHVALLDGGWDGWRSDQLPVTDEVYFPLPSSFEPRPVDAYSADLDWINRHVQFSEVVLLDVRTQAEFENGHIANAVWWDWENGTADEALFRDADAVRTELARLGLTPDKEIVTYCHSGMRAAHTFFLLRHLGFKRVRMYDGSWAEWSAVKQG